MAGISNAAYFLFREGRVHRITDNGDVRVQFPGKPEQQFRWTVNPAALTKVRESAYSTNASTGCPEVQEVFDTPLIFGMG